MDKTITQSTLNEQAEHRAIAFARVGQPSQTEATRLRLCRLALHLDARLAILRRKKCPAINLVARPAIWGESGVSMMNPTPDPPYKISRNFKLQSCGPNFHVEQ